MTEVSDRINEASKFFSRGEYQRTLDIYSSLLKDNPSDIDLLLRRASVHFLLQFWDDMNSDIKEVLTLDPDYPKRDYILNGFLKKEPEKKGVGIAKSRYFYVKSKFVFYYKLPHDTEAIGWFCLEKAIVGEDVKANSFSITVFGVGRVYVLSASNEAEKKEWVNAMGYVCDPSNTIHNVIENKNLESKNPTSSDHAGFAFKRGKHNTSWKKRYFALKGPLLFYYQDDKEDQTPLGTIEIKDCKCLPIAVKEKVNIRYKFAIETISTRTYYLYVETEEDRITWISKIRTASTEEKKKRDTINIGQYRKSTKRESVQKKENNTNITESIDSSQSELQNETTLSSNSNESDVLDKEKTSSRSFKRTNKHSLEITSLTPESQKPKVEEKRFYISKDSKGIDREELVEPLLDEEGGFWEDIEQHHEKSCWQNMKCNKCSLL